MTTHRQYNPDSKVHGANMGHIWGRQDPSGPHVGPMNFAIWEYTDDNIDILVASATPDEGVWLAKNTKFWFNR